MDKIVNRVSSSSYLWCFYIQKQGKWNNKLQVYLRSQLLFCACFRPDPLICGSDSTRQYFPQTSRWLFFSSTLQYQFEQVLRSRNIRYQYYVKKILCYSGNPRLQLSQFACFSTCVNHFLLSTAARPRCFVVSTCAVAVYTIENTLLGYLY